MTVTDMCQHRAPALGRPKAGRRPGRRGAPRALALLLPLALAGCVAAAPTPWHGDEQPKALPACPPAALAIPFAEGSEALDAGARDALAEAVDAFRCQERQVMISGHGDPGSAAAAGLERGDRRARAAALYLVMQGVPASAIRTVTHGNEQPRCTEPTPTCQAENRRVEVVVDGPVVPVAESSPKEVDRFPTVASPDEVVEGQLFAVEVSLTEELMTPEVKVRPGGTVEAKPTGELALGPALPAIAPGETWTIDVTVLSPGFEVIGPNLGSIRLPPHGDSTVAQFKLKAKGAAQPLRTAPLFASFWFKGQFLAKVVREVRIRSLAKGVAALPAAPAPGPAAAPARSVTRATTTTSPDEDGDVGVPADLTLQLLAGTDPGHPELGVVSVFGPRLQPAQTATVAPPDLDGWLAGRYGALAVAGRGLKRAPGPTPKAQAAALLQGVGRELYGRTPKVVQGALQKLVAQAVRARRDGKPPPSLQILTTDPRFPWELVLVPGPDGKELRVGDAFSVARWHVTVGDAVADRPAAFLPVDRLVAMAPAYQGAMALPGQATELAALGLLAGAGMQRVPGTRQGLEEAVGVGVGRTILHYSGHGAARHDQGAAPAFDLALEDGAMGASEWSGLLGPGRAPALVFLNACEVGQAEPVAGRAYGWGPAALEGGAAAFVGPLWPIDDGVAVAAARIFYGAVQAGRPVAEALRLVRAEYATRGDPSYLAYVFYGDPALRLDWTTGP